jgi:uncharacterized cupredoxin-like copper-binding protein
MFRIVSTTRLSARFASAATTGAVVAALALSGSTVLAQETPEITVVLNESSFAPKTVTLTLGQPVQLNIQNQGKADHNMLSDLPLSSVKYLRADNSSSDLHRYEATNVMDADAKAGHTSVVLLTPGKAGMFEFHSDENDDQELGMSGSFVVQAAGTAAAAAPVSAAPAASPSTGSSAARDGQSLTNQSSATQAAFSAAWGGAAAQRWVQEHEAELSRSGR